MNIQSIPYHYSLEARLARYIDSYRSGGSFHRAIYIVYHDYIIPIRKELNMSVSDPDNLILYRIALLRIMNDNLLDNMPIYQHPRERLLLMQSTQNISKEEQSSYYNEIFIHHSGELDKKCNRDTSKQLMTSYANHYNKTLNTSNIVETYLDNIGKNLQFHVTLGTIYDFVNYLHKEY